jgi:rhodanese-related sulfurtransferase
MKSFRERVNDCLETVDEVFPWDLKNLMESEQSPLLVDVRAPHEFDTLHIKGSMNVPEGILESSCNDGYNETQPKLVTARDKDVVVVCHAGLSSVLATHTMIHKMGFQSVKSLKTGVKGWNDFEQPLQNVHGQEVDVDEAEKILKQIKNST